MSEQQQPEGLLQVIKPQVELLRPYAGVLEAYARGLPVQLNGEALAQVLRAASFVAWVVVINDVIAETVAIDPQNPPPGTQGAS